MLIFLQQNKWIFTLNGISRFNCQFRSDLQADEFCHQADEKPCFQSFLDFGITGKGVQTFMYLYDETRKIPETNDPFLQKTYIRFQIHYKLTDIFSLILLNVHLKYIYT